MTVQEAYNKGLDVAEEEAYLKLDAALRGEDIGAFNNPKMEDLRQRVLTTTIKKESSIVEDFFSGKEIVEDELSPFDKKTLKLLKFCRSSVPKKPTSRLSVILRDLLRDLDLDIQLRNDKLD